MEDDVIDGPDLDWEEDAYVEEKALKASMPIAEAIEESKQAAWQKAMASLNRKLPAQAVSAVDHAASTHTATFQRVMTYTLAALKESVNIPFTAQVQANLRALWATEYAREAERISPYNPTSYLVSPVASVAALVPTSNAPRPTNSPEVSSEVSAIVDSAIVSKRKRKSAAWLSACTDSAAGVPEEEPSATPTTTYGTPAMLLLEDQGGDLSTDAKLSDFTLPDSTTLVPVPTDTKRLTTPPAATNGSIKHAFSVANDYVRQLRRNHRVETNPYLSPDVVGLEMPTTASMSAAASASTPTPHHPPNIVLAKIIRKDSTHMLNYVAEDCFLSIGGHEIFVKRLGIRMMPLMFPLPPTSPPTTAAGSATNTKSWSSLDDADQSTTRSGSIRIGAPLDMRAADGASIHTASSIGRALESVFRAQPSLSAAQRGFVRRRLRDAISTVMTERGVCLPEASIHGDLALARYSEVGVSVLALGSHFALFTPTPPDSVHKPSDNVLRFNYTMVYVVHVTTEGE